ncbi:MAG: ATP-dependent DNA helicase [Alcaligenaceae bacterium]|nr:ATP-dependent DNA helicase [Alcaligenaceae bacterium]
MKQKLKTYFDEQGVLSQHIPNYQTRSSQIELSQRIWDCIANKDTLVAEAGTGTGKTWAYLVPAFLSHQQTIVSTATKALQDQIFRVDIPKLKQVFSHKGLDVALLKGRSNYVCLYKMALFSQEISPYHDAKEIKQHEHIVSFVRTTRSGDISECDTVPEKSPIWSRMVSRKEECAHEKCPCYEDCFLFKARKRVERADIILVNHSLFFSDLSLRKEGGSGLLPDAGLVVFDEAHRLADVGTQFMGEHLSQKHMMAVLDDLRIYFRTHTEHGYDWSKLVNDVDTQWNSLQFETTRLVPLKDAYLQFEVLTQTRWITQLKSLIASCVKLRDYLKVLSETSEGLSLHYVAFNEMLAILSHWVEAQPESQDKTQKISEDSIQKTQKRQWIKWIDKHSKHLSFHTAPLDLRDFSHAKSSEQAWVFTSATLSVHQSLDYFKRDLGLNKAQDLLLPSCFDYKKQSVLYVPNDFPSIRDEAYMEAFVRRLLELMAHNVGGVLLLTTTLRAIDVYAELIEKTLPDMPIFYRDEIDSFKQAGRGVLIGSFSLWEGVDFPGHLVTLVAIDKLPFLPPDEPVTFERSRVLEEKGHSSFFNIQVPYSAVHLKQGVGRLIRKESDVGVVFIGDNRLVNKSYGQLIWSSLPEMSRTNRLSRVIDFMKAKLGQT